jgi:mono/diheme cytochrome c family protein
MMKADRKQPPGRNVPALDSTAEPSANNVAAPVWVFVLLGVLVYWGQLYLDRNAGGFESAVYEPYLSTNQLAKMRPVSAEGALAALGRDVYGRTCVLCHQATGLGTPGQFPPLAGSEWLTGAGPNRLTRIVIHGLAGPIKVKGQDWNASMAALGGSLSDEEIAAVLTFVRQEFGGGASLVKPEEVKKVRDATAARSEPWTSAELASIPESD